jgi:hypothetical protein
VQLPVPVLVLQQQEQQTDLGSHKLQEQGLPLFYTY